MKPAALALVGLLPMAFLPALLVRVADGAAHAGAVALDGVTRSLFASEPGEPPLVFVEPLAGTTSAEAPPSTKKLARHTVPQKGVRVRAATVLRLANAGQCPTGVPVPARAGHPAGVALVGVSALGIGLQDGDILVSAAGRPTLTSGDVVGVVIGSRAHHVSEISGRFYRNGEPWNLVVEQPYVRRRNESGRVALAR
jgi:hypothetical protein